MIKINIKHGKQLYKDIEVSPEEGVETFRLQVFSITNVPPERQKIMMRGKVIQDTTDLPTLGLKNVSFNQAKGTNLLLMGTKAGDEYQKPQEEMKFLEDLTPQERAKLYKEKTGEVMPAGLINLGNTCYANSLMQCFNRIKELRDEVDQAPSGNDALTDPNKAITAATKELFNEFQNAGKSFRPLKFIFMLQQVFPQFAQTDNNGNPMQQDAEECYINLLNAYSKGLQGTGDESGEDVIDRLFGVKLRVTLTCDEDEQIPPKVTYEKLRKLPCHISNQQNPISHLAQGVRVSLKEQVEKYAEQLERDALFTKKSEVDSLPSYLTIHFMRFHWKEKSVMGGTDATKTKLLRKVNFPVIFDLYEFCTEDIRQALQPGRELEIKLREIETENMGKKSLKEEQKGEQVGKKKDSILYREHGTGLPNGNYQLIGVVTHKGRDADSGHYIGWVHRSGDEWYEYDDDIVTTVTTEQVLDLCGGGDWHTAYLCIYRRIEIDMQDAE